MAVLLKFKAGINRRYLSDALEALDRVGLPATRLFPGQSRQRLASIFSIEAASVADLSRVRKVLEEHHSIIDYIEVAPTDRKPM